MQDVTYRNGVYLKERFKIFTQNKYFAYSMTHKESQCHGTLKIRSFIQNVCVEDTAHISVFKQQ